MRRRIVCALSLLALLCLSGCVTLETDLLYNKIDAAHSAVYSYELQTEYHWTFTAPAWTFQRDGTASQKVIDHADYQLISHAQTTDNGVPYTFTSYIKDDCVYFDDRGAKYKRKTTDDELALLKEDILAAHRQDAFSSVRVENLQNGGKQLTFVLEPRVVGPEADSFLKSSLAFMDFAIAETALQSFQYTLTIDDAYLVREEDFRAEAVLTLSDGTPVQVQYALTQECSAYNTFDRLAFPDDLNTYPDLFA